MTGRASLWAERKPRQPRPEVTRRSGLPGRKSASFPTPGPRVSSGGAWPSAARGLAPSVHGAPFRRRQLRAGQLQDGAVPEAAAPVPPGLRLPALPQRPGPAPRPPQVPVPVSAGLAPWAGGGRKAEACFPPRPLLPGAQIRSGKAAESAWPGTPAGDPRAAGRELPRPWAPCGRWAGHGTGVRSSIPALLRTKALTRPSACHLPVS